MMRSLVGLFTLLFVLPSGAINYDDTVRYLNIYYSDAATKAVQLIDPKASVQVQIKPKYTEIKLPLSGLPAKQFMINQTDGNPEVETISIKVFSDQGYLPPQVTAELEALFNWTDVKPELQMINSSPASNWNLDYMWRRYSKPENIFLAFSVFSFLGLFVFGLALYRQYASRIANAIQAAVSELKGGKTQPLSPSLSSQMSSESNSPAKAPTGDEGHSFEGMSVESVAALMFDCYWSEKDHYARFVWDHLSVPTKQELVARHPALISYSDHVCTVTAEARDWHMNPFYLKPLDMNHLDNESVKSLVLKNPGLYNSISPLRKQSIRLGPKQSIEFSRKPALSEEEASQLLGSQKPSKPRRLPLKISVNIESIEEEAEILSIPDLPFEIKEKVPSLGWLQHIPEETARKILGRFNAVDIANAWIGPAKVLEFVEGLIPPEKMELIKSYREKVIPNRGGAMDWIHGMCMDEIRNQEAMKADEKTPLAS